SLAFILPGFLVVDSCDELRAGRQQRAWLERGRRRHLPWEPRAEVLQRSLRRACRDRRIAHDGRRARKQIDGADLPRAIEMSWEHKFLCELHQIRGYRERDVERQHEVRLAAGPVVF